MSYIFRSIVFNESKQLVSAITAIDGIGRSRASYIIDSCGFSRKISLNSLNIYGFNLLAVIANRFYIVSDDLIRERLTSVHFLRKLNSYKSINFNFNLPIRGQLTKTNAKTCKSRRLNYKRVKKRRDKKQN